MSDEVHDDDASLPTWHAEEILPPSGNTPSQHLGQGQAAQTPQPARVSPAAAQTPPPPPANTDEKSLVAVAAATAAATTLVLLAAAAGGFFFLTRSSDTDTTTTPNGEVASPSLASDEATTRDEPGEPSGQEDSNDPTDAKQPEPVAVEPEPVEDAAGDTNDAPADGATSPTDRRAASAMLFEVAGVDNDGRPVPVLPRYLVGSTENPDQLPNYHADPERVPEVGPYTVAKGGFFFLRGTVPSENIRQELIRRMLLVTSRDSLIIEMAVDESDPWYLDQSVPLYFEDAIQFDIGQAELQIDVLRVFLRIAELVALSPDITLEITGHTDNVGSEDSNLALSQERVDQVAGAFATLGAPADQLEAVARGEADPIASNATEAGRATNRRVEFAILYPEPLDALE